jgi:hypothetical protein
MTSISKILQQIEMTEAGVSRIYTYINQARTPFAIITAFRKNKTKKENLRNNSDLANILNSQKLGAINIIGHGQEEDSEGVIQPSEERSFFVPYSGSNFENFKQLMLSLGQRYEQWGIVLSDGKDIQVLKSNGEIDMSFSRANFKPSDLEPFFSKIKNVKFAFESKVSKFLNEADFDAADYKTLSNLGDNLCHITIGLILAKTQETKATVWDSYCTPDQKEIAEQWMKKQFENDLEFNVSEVWFWHVFEYPSSTPIDQLREITKADISRMWKLKKQANAKSWGK